MSELFIIMEKQEKQELRVKKRFISDYNQVKTFRFYITSYSVVERMDELKAVLKHCYGKGEYIYDYLNITCTSDSNTIQFRIGLYDTNQYIKKARYEEQKILENGTNGYDTFSDIWSLFVSCLSKALEDTNK